MPDDLPEYNDNYEVGNNAEVQLKPENRIDEAERRVNLKREGKLNLSNDYGNIWDNLHPDSREIALKNAAFNTKLKNNKWSDFQGYERIPSRMHYERASRMMGIDPEKNPNYNKEDINTIMRGGSTLSKRINNFVTKSQTISK